MFLYLDTQALVMRYKEEPQTQIIDRLFQGRSPQDRFFISYLGVLEFLAVIWRQAKRARAITDSIAGALVRVFDHDIDQGQLEVCPVTYRILFRSSLEIGEYALRAGDAIHLATAKEIALYLGRPNSHLVMVSNDQQLLDAAGLSGFTTLDPRQANALQILAQIRRPHSQSS